MIGVLLIVVVIVLSGLIAYVGDQIGMKVGKKRISVFGLRPKYTSIVITVLTGVLIAGLTLTILLATNNGVRQAIFNIQKTYNELLDTRNDLDSLNQQFVAKDQDLQETNERLAESEIELQKKDSLLNQRQEEIEKIEGELDTLKGQREELVEKNNSLVKENNSLEEQRDQLQVKLDNLQKELQTARESIVELKATKSRLEEQRQALETQITYLEDTTLRYYTQDLVYQKGEIIYLDVIKKESTQQETVDNILDFVAKANQEVRKRNVRVDENGSAILMQDRDAFSLAARILASDAEKFIVSMFSSANVSTNMYVPVGFQMSPDFVVYQKGEMIAEEIIDASQAFPDVEDDLMEILETVHVESVKKGIITNEQGTVVVIDFSRGYEVLNKLQSYQGNVRLRVHATEDIWVEDGWNGQFSNKIRFDLEPVGDNGEE
ncbi:MAG: DUF3084 domain-containing protein [Halanaerobiales bacterium]